MNDVRKVAIDVIEKFRAAKAWVASDSYDGIDARGRELLEEADSAAKQFLATLPAEGEAWYPSAQKVAVHLGIVGCNFGLMDQIIHSAIDLYRERGGQVGVSLPPVAHDESYDRDYIPLPGGWEIQTKGKGSTFRISDPQGERVAVTSERLHEPLTRMALDIRAAYPHPATVPAEVMKAIRRCVEVTRLFYGEGTTGAFQTDCVVDWLKSIRGAGHGKVEQILALVDRYVGVLDGSAVEQSGALGDIRTALSACVAEKCKNCGGGLTVGADDSKIEK